MSSLIKTDAVGANIARRKCRVWKVNWTWEDTIDNVWLLKVVFLLISAYAVVDRAHKVLRSASTSGVNFKLVRAHHALQPAITVSVRKFVGKAACFSRCAIAIFCDTVFLVWRSKTTWACCELGRFGCQHWVMLLFQMDPGGCRQREQARSDRKTENCGKFHIK